MNAKCISRPLSVEAVTLALIIRVYTKRIWELLPTNLLTGKETKESFVDKNWESHTDHRKGRLRRAYGKLRRKKTFKK